MTITFIGHAAVLIKGSKNILIDPFFTDNPKAALLIKDLPKIDFILVTHDHFDHLGDAVKITKKHEATLVVIHEVAIFPVVKKAKINVVGMNIGGTYKDKGVTVSMTNAVHSANFGSPAGFVVKMDGKRIYHAGDTALFSDMALIPKIFGKLDVAFLPIGGHYVMDIKQAAMAVNLLKPKITIPIHYNTWPIIAADPKMFIRACAPSRVKILKSGENYEL